VQACVAFVFKVWVAQYLRIVPNYALHKGQVIEEDGAAQTPGYVNPEHR
jgi:hypothetical protein